MNGPQRSNVIELGSSDDEFGLCPKCQRTNGHLNVGRNHYGVCRLHRVQWRIGENLFSAWRDESESEWQRNAVLLAGYRFVIAFYRFRTGDSPEPPAAA